MGKLVRDNIPDIILANGETPKTRVLDNEEYLKELGRKAVEEASEFAVAVNPEDALEELADLQEVINASLVALGKTPQELEVVRAKKAEERGDFSSRIFLES